MYLYLDSKHWAIGILSMVLLNCICSIKQPQNIWKDITMKEMTSSNQTSFSLNLKSFFKRPFGAAIDKINNKSFVHCLVQENVLLVILSNLTALYVWQCRCVSSTSEGVSSVPLIQSFELPDWNGNEREIRREKVQMKSLPPPSPG